MASDAAGLVACASKWQAKGVSTISTGIRFVHTADWQLGMPANFLSEEARHRFGQARLDAVERIGAEARARGAAFVVVAGDVFEYNMLSRQTVSRALDAMGAMGVPVLLLPGNHDPLDATTIFEQRSFTEACPPNVHVLTEDGPQRQLEGVLPPGLEVVAAPWRTKHPAVNPLGAVLAALDPVPGRLRLVVGHGGMDVLGVRDDLDILNLQALEAAVADGRAHYIALGDRHSTTRLGAHHRIWYAGTPEVYAFDEVDPGNILLVDLSAGGVEVTPIRVGAWTFVDRTVSLNDADDVDHLEEWIRHLPQKPLTAVRLHVSGLLPLEARERVAQMPVTVGASLAGLEIVPEGAGLHIRPADGDLSVLPPGSFARSVAERLRDRAVGAGEDAAVAEAALGLLLRVGVGA